jgi:hypothetical protein
MAVSMPTGDTNRDESKRAQECAVLCTRQSAGSRLHEDLRGALELHKVGSSLSTISSLRPGHSEAMSLSSWVRRGAIGVTTEYCLAIWSIRASKGATEALDAHRLACGGAYHLRTYAHSELQSVSGNLAELKSAFRVLGR